MSSDDIALSVTTHAMHHGKFDMFHGDFV